MNGQALPIDAGQLALAGVLVAAAGAVSVALRLGLGRRLLVASARTVIQLLLVGYVLKWVFAREGPALLLAILLVMVAAAGRAAVQRGSRTYKRAMGDAFVTLALSATATTFTVTSLVIGVAPWYRAQYVIPLMGMVLGNSLTGVSLCMDSMLQAIDEGRDAIEAELALGATRWEALSGPLRDAVRRGSIPILNAMTVAGIVSLPGMMTGQILGGADPFVAVKYQVVVMFMIAAATSLGTMGAALFLYVRLTNARHQLVPGAVRKRGG